MELRPDGSAQLEDGSRLSWIADAHLGAIGLLELSAEPLDAAANARIAQLFAVFLGGYQAQGATQPFLLVEATLPERVDRRFALLVHEFKWINFYGGGLAVLNPSPAVEEAFTDSAVAGYIRCLSDAPGRPALDQARTFFQGEVWNQK